MCKVQLIPKSSTKEDPSSPSNISHHLHSPSYSQQVAFEHSVGYTGGRGTCVLMVDYLDSDLQKVVISTVTVVAEHLTKKWTAHFSHSYSSLMRMESR